ncbi:hypothetical protein K8R66_01360 [bacterium]|nr:hypothetical protein [bacterium]
MRNNKNIFKEGIKNKNLKKLSTGKVSRVFIFSFKYHKIIIIFEIVLILSLGYLFLLFPKFEKLKEEKSAVARKKGELLIIENYQLKTKELMEKYRDLKTKKEKEINRLYEVLPREENLYNLMAQMESLVLANGLFLGDIIMTDISAENEIRRNKDLPIETESIENNSIIGEVEVSIFVFGGNGGYDQFKDFLAALESHVRLIDISSLSFDQNIESYSIIFKTYYLKDET